MTVFGAAVQMVCVVLNSSYYIFKYIILKKTSTDQCSEGTYRNSDGECVSQCPCGYYGDTNSRICEGMAMHAACRSQILFNVWHV